MRQYAVPVLFEERPREIGGLLTFRQAGYLGAAVLVSLPLLVRAPAWVSLPVTAMCLIICAALAFGRIRGMPADFALWLLLRYAGRCRAAVWQTRR